MPVLKALGGEFGEDRVFAIARDVIVLDAWRSAQGRELAKQMGWHRPRRVRRRARGGKKGDAYRMAERSDE